MSDHSLPAYFTEHVENNKLSLPLSGPLVLQYSRSVPKYNVVLGWNSALESINIPVKRDYSKNQSKVRPYKSVLILEKMQIKHSHSKILSLHQ